MPERNPVSARRGAPRTIPKTRGRFGAPPVAVILRAAVREACLFRGVGAEDLTGHPGARRTEASLCGLSARRMVLISRQSLSYHPVMTPRFRQRPRPVRHKSKPAWVQDPLGRDCGCTV